MTFTDLGLGDEILRAITDMGFVEPTDIQAEAIPHLLTGTTDLVGLAQTGTGKTGAFGLPLLDLVDTGHQNVQAIIVCPTRELCLQIQNDLDQFSAHLPSTKSLAVYGGTGIQQQIKSLKRGGIQIIVATPGRLCDLIRRKAADLSHVRFAVLDEADEMLNMGFQEDLESILGQLPHDRKIWLFSATMGKGVARIADRLLEEPVEITIGAKNSTAKKIDHSAFMVMEKNRYPALKRLLDFAPQMVGLIFCRTRRETQQTAERLMADGYAADALHGDLSQAQRDYVMRKFRQGNIRMLVATDVAARGIDVDDISHVIHYRLPDDSEVYTHRSGRTGRAGREGSSYVLTNTKEKSRLRNLERDLGIEFQKSKVPEGRDICEKQLFALVEKVKNTEVNHDEIDQYLPAVREAFADMDKDELIQHFLSAEFNRFLDYYRDTGDINATARAKDNRGDKRDRKDRKERRERRDDDREWATFFINVGKMDNIGVGAIVRLVCDEAGIDSKAIGAIKLNREFSFFDVEASVADDVRSGMANVRFDGRDVRVNDAERSARSSRGGGGGHRNGGGFKRGGGGGYKKGGGGFKKGGFNKGGRRDDRDNRDNRDNRENRGGGGWRDRNEDRQGGGWHDRKEERGGGGGGGWRDRNEDKPRGGGWRDRDDKPRSGGGGWRDRKDDRGQDRGNGGWRDRKDKDRDSRSGGGGGGWRDRKDDGQQGGYNKDKDSGPQPAWKTRSKPKFPKKRKGSI